MRPDITPGAVFPDYAISDHTAKRRKLSELQGPHPMILVLSRGGFCPKDRRQSELLVQFHREIEVAYTRLVTISTDNLTETSDYRTGVGAHWPFPSPKGNQCMSISCMVGAVGIELSSPLQTRKLFIPRSDKTHKNARNAEVRYTAGTRRRYA